MQCALPRTVTVISGSIARAIRQSSRRPATPTPIWYYAAAKQWGDKDFNRLDKYTIAVPHPDATAALIAGGTELSGAG